VEEVAIFERRSQQRAVIAVWYSLFYIYLTLTIFPASNRTRSSGRSWGSVTRRYRHTAATTAATTVGTSTMVSDISLSPIPSLATLPNNDFGSSLASSILEKGVFESVEEEDEAQFTGPSASSHGVEETKSTELGDPRRPPIKVMVTSDIGMVSSASPVPTASSSNAQVRPQPQRSPASKPISPSAIASGSWIANRMQEPTLNGLYRSAPTPTPSPNPSYYSSNSSAPSQIGRAVSVPLTRAPTSNLDGSQASDSSPPPRHLTMSPGTTPTQPLAIRKTGSANALIMTHQEMADDPRSTGRGGPLSSNQNNRHVSIYSPSGPESSATVRGDPMELYAAYSTDPSFLPYLTPPSPSAPTPHARSHPSPPTRALPASPPTSKMLNLPKALSATQHSRQMSSSSTSESDLDVSRYKFPEAPGQQPTVLPREIHPASLDMIVEGENGGPMPSRSPPEHRKAPPHPHQQQPTPMSSSPPRTASRAPVLPGAYQATLRSAMEADVPDGPPPLYQPRASRRYHTDLSQDQDYPEPSLPTSYSPLRVASPSSKGMTRLLDTSSATLRPGQRTAPASPLSETYSPADGSPTEKYPPEVRPTEKAHYAAQRSGTGRRPSDPYHRLLSAAAKVSPPPPSMSRRGSSSYLQGQGLSPHSAMSPHSDGFDSSNEYSSSDPRSRPPSQTFSTYTRGTRHSTWGASQATATAVDHHEFDFPQEDDDGMYYTSMLADLDGSENERGRIFKEAVSARGPRASTGKEPQRMHTFPSPPMPQIPRNLAFTKHQVLSEPALSRSPSRQLPTPPLGPTPGPAHPYFPGGMGWDELDRPIPRKLSRMEKALLRRVEFGPNITAADVAAIPLA
jgi:hypothetical protein